VLDGQQPLEDCARGQRGLADRDGVQVERLIVKPLPFGFGFDVVGNDEAGDQL